MSRISHFANRLSIRLLGAAMLAGCAIAAAGSQASVPMPVLSSAVLSSAAASSAAARGPAPTSSTYYGRWTVSEDRPVFSARGIAYKTVDIGPCGRDFCGISVDAKGKCGITLFRFYGFRASSGEPLHGHGRWGKGRKNIQVSTWEDAEAPGGKVIDLYLGEGYDFGERSENMPKFHATYRPTGRALCFAR